MFVNFNKSCLIPLMLLSFGFHSCGMKTKNDKDVEIQSDTVTVSTDPNISLAAVAPDGILYIDKPESLPPGQPLLHGIYQAIGNGGLGADLNQTDKLTPYPGIPLTSTLTELDEKTLIVSLSSTGDIVCESAFTYNAKEKLIEINPTKINKLTICNLEIVASAPFKDKNYTAKSSFEVVLNPTMKTYFNSLTNTSMSYLRGNVLASSADTLANKLKSLPNSSLSLNYESHPSTYNMDKLDILTGLQNLKGLDVSGTNLSDLRAVRFLKNLESLDISNTKIVPAELKILADLPNLKSLAIRNLSITDLTLIAKYLPKLESLDISGNKIQDLSILSSFKNLKTLKIENIGVQKNNLKELMQSLKNLIQLNKLDLSKNDLSGLTISEDSGILAELDLESLNVSESFIKDSFLDDYFKKINGKIIGIKEFIDRNKTNMSKVTKSCVGINNFDYIPNLEYISSLIRLDLHGNGCNVDGNPDHDIGLRSTSRLSRMISLQYLDISNTAVSSLDGLRSLHFLKTVLIADPEGGIDMSRQACLASVQHFSLGVHLDCSSLRQAGTFFQRFDAPGATSWQVPANVWSVTLSGCSGANGASGAGGGGGGASMQNVILSDTEQTSRDSFGGNGGKSGVANGSNFLNGTSGTFGVCATLLDVEPWTVHNKVHTCGGGFQAPSGGSGGDAGIGGHTSFGNKIFSIASSNLPRDIHSCFGGISNSGGNGGAGVDIDEHTLHSFHSLGGHGGIGGHGIDGWSSPKEENISYDVTPGELIPIVVGNGGQGGAGGAGGANQCTSGTWFDGCSVGGAQGAAGTAGQNGYLTIEYQK